MVKSVLVYLLLGVSSEAFYVSYETKNQYLLGDSLSVVSNKLTSATSLSSIDYNLLPLCGSTSDVGGGSWWDRATKSLHADAFRNVNALTLRVGGDLHCTTLCEVDVEENLYRDAIFRDFAYNWYIDGLPVAFRTEDDSTVSTRYWGGIPVGRMGGGMDENPRYTETADTDAYIYNHFNFDIYYRFENNKFEVIRVIVEPFSVDHASDSSGVVSCDDQSSGNHLDYDMLRDVRPQPASGTVRFTYDVQWFETQKPHKDRWSVFLEMDSVPAWIEFMGFFLGVFILITLVGSLYTWVMRDLSYKPVVNESDVSEEEAGEIQMWPLSTRIFFPPRNAPVLLCVACGTGANLLTSGFLFALFFRFGIINAAQGAGILTPAVVLYSLCSCMGGYVTGRLYSIFHGERGVAIAASLVTAVAYPLLGLLVVVLVFDVFPDASSPNYNVISNSTPLVLVWIFVSWPLSVAGGFLGHRGGPIQNFPVSSGSQGYQDLNLQDDSENKEEVQEMKRGKWWNCMRRYRITVCLLFGGLLPLLSCFVSYSYAVAGPIFLGYYPVRAYMVASYLLFQAVAGAVAVLAYYRQIRAYLFNWWWSSFATASSAGLYVFMLSISYMLFKAESHIQGNTMAAYTFWFAFISFGTAMATGFVGVSVCMWFNKALYTVLMNRQ